MSAGQTDNPLVLTWAKRFDVIEVFDHLRDVTHPEMVMGACGTAERGYRCVTCQVHAPTLADLILHLDPGGAHHVVTWCSRHRWFECADAAQIAGFAQLVPTDGAE